MIKGVKTRNYYPVVVRNRMGDKGSARRKKLWTTRERNKTVTKGNHMSGICARPSFNSAQWMRPGQERPWYFPFRLCSRAQDVFLELGITGRGLLGGLGSEFRGAG